jgi:hypothetical protein
MLLQTIAGLACLFAALLQLAVHRSPDHTNRSPIKQARRLTVGALAVGAVVLLGAAWTGQQENMLSLVGGLFALGQILYAMNNLLEHEPWKSHLNSSR